MTAPCLLLRDASQGPDCLTASHSQAHLSPVLFLMRDLGPCLAPYRSLPKACLSCLASERLLGPQIARKACSRPARSEHLIDLPLGSQTQTCLIACVIVFTAVF